MPTGFLFLFFLAIFQESDLCSFPGKTAWTTQSTKVPGFFSWAFASFANQSQFLRASWWQPEPRHASFRRDIPVEVLVNKPPLMTGLNGFMQRNITSSLTPSKRQIPEGSGKEKNTKCKGKSFSFWYPPRLHLHALYLPLLTPHNFFPKLSQTSITFYTPSYKPSSIFTASHRPSATSTNLLYPFIHFLHLHILYFPLFTFLQSVKF